MTDDSEWNPCSFDTSADGDKSLCVHDPIVKVEVRCKHGHESTLLACNIHFAAMLLDDDTSCWKCAQLGNRSHKCPVIWDWEKLAA